MRELLESPDLSVREEAARASRALGDVGPPAPHGGDGGSPPSDASARAAAAAAAMGAVGHAASSGAGGSAKGPLPACRVSAPGEPLEPLLVGKARGQPQPLSDLSWRAHNEQIRQLIGKARARAARARRCARHGWGPLARGARHGWGPLA